MPNYDKASKIIAFTTCNSCGKTIPQVLALKSMDEHYCDDNCRNDDLLKRLRCEGM